jgi:hypothetical protein
MKLKFFGNSAKNYASTYLKFIINHLQIISSLYYLNFKFYDNNINYIGDPVGSIVYSLDCLAPKIKSLPLISLRLIWILF